MRAQLHAERPALERLLERIERGSLSATERGLLARQLRHFSFIEHLSLALSEEQELAERYRAAVDTTLVRDSTTRPDSFNALMTAINRDIPSSVRVLDTRVLATCQDIAQRVTKVNSSLNSYDRDALAALLERKSAGLLTAIAERARDAYAAVDTLAREQHYSRERAQAAASAYSGQLLRLESRARTLHSLARGLRVPRHEESPSTTLLVGASSRSSLDHLERILAASGNIIRFKHIPYFAVLTDAQTAQDVLARTGALGHEARIYRERVYSVSPIPAVRLRDEQWNVDLVNAPGAWSVTRGNGASVAIIDTGADYLHTDLAERFTTDRGVNFAGYGDPLDDNGHGTHVAGTVAGKKTGVAPEATLYAVKVLDGDGYGTETSVLRGIEWAIDKGVHVMNMSLGSSYPSSAEKELVALAAQHGISVACAAGNSGDGDYEYPASYDGATSVAAVDQQKRRAPFSTYNDAVDLAAPGVAIYSCVPGDAYDSLSGTSMASPHVAGAYALLASRGVQDREKTLVQTAERLGARDEYGAGLINCAAAVAATTSSYKTARKQKL